MSQLNYKTISLTGTELEVKLSGQNCDIRNDGTDTVYAAGEAEITAGADGVMSVPAGQTAKLLGCNGTLYLLGTGSVMLCGNDYSEPVFKSAASASGGGGTVDQTARDTINLHANNTDIHMTAEEVAELVSGENHLINPDFAINQRGQTKYTSDGYTVDHWAIVGGIAELDVSDNSATLTVTSDVSDEVYFLAQLFEKPLGAGCYTFSIKSGQSTGSFLMRIRLVDADGNYLGRIKKTVDANAISSFSYNVPDGTFIHSVSIGCENTAAGSTVEIEWAKLEAGEFATPFVPPDIATEFAKCQRYYQLHSTGNIDPLDLRPTMCTITDIKQRGDGSYEYIAEL